MPSPVDPGLQELLECPWLFLIDSRILGFRNEPLSDRRLHDTKTKAIVRA